LRLGNISLPSSVQEAISKLEKAHARKLESVNNQVKEYEKKARTTQEFLDRKDQLDAELNTLKDTLNKRIKEFEQQLT
jgi:hypothetical protein